MDAVNQNQFKVYQEFFKALADQNRLRIIGLLVNRPYTVEELAAILWVRPSTISHHLSMLADINLVSARGDGHYKIYELDFSEIQDKAQQLLAEETFADFAADVDLDAYDRGVLETYLLPDGRFKQIPSQRKKLEVLLRFILKDFEPDRIYTEPEVNAIIDRYHDDISGLRRDLIEYRLLTRDQRGSEYRLAAESA